MVEMVASAMVGEALSRISSFLIDKPGGRKPSERDDVERLEMAHIKMEAALHMSSKWQITEAPVLRWRSRLKRAAQECDDTLRRCKQRALELEDEAARQGVSQSSIPKRIAHAARSFMPSFITHGRGHGEDEPRSSSSVNVRRFERFAEGAGEFLKFVEFGATPRPHAFFNPLIGQLLAGKALRYQALRGSRFYYLSVRPQSFEERGVEAMVGFVLQDFREPAKSFCLGFMLRLSESSDLFGIIIRCMQSVTPPHFKGAVEAVRRELIQLPTQDFSWRTHSPYGENSYWVHVHNTLTHWFRPNPLCCDEHEHGLSTHASCYSTSSSHPNGSSPSRSRLASTFLEQVIVIYLQRHIPAQKRRLQNSATEQGRGRKGSKTPALLKLGLLSIPHDSPEGIEPTADSFAFEVIDGEEQEMVERNASLQDVDKKLLPKAIDYLHHNPESTMYQMCLRSRHGTAHLCVEKAATQPQSAGIGKSARSQPLSQIQNRRVGQGRGDYSVEGWQKVSRDLLKLWVVRASDKLHGSIRSWADNSPCLSSFLLL